jgi:hypothetical protein
MLCLKRGIMTEYLKIDNSQSGLFSKFQSLHDSELSWYENEALRQFGINKFPKRNEDQLIQQILGKSPNDETKKKNRSDYYIANVIAYLRVVKEILTDDFIGKFGPDRSVDNLTVYNYHRVFQNLLFDSLILLNEYCVNVKGTVPEYGCGKGYSQHTLTLYQSLRQSIFGQSSYHSFIKIEPDLSISIIRQLVELRVRRAFGVLGWYHPDNQSMEPLPLTVLFDVLKKYAENIDLSIPLDCLIRIYGWSNIYLHIGIKDCSWKHIFVTNYLHEFAIGKEDLVATNSGIVVPQEVLENIIIDLEKNNHKGAQVIRCNPDAKIKA